MALDATGGFGSTNPYRRQESSGSQDADKELATNLLQSVDSEKQVVEPQSFDSEKQLAGPEVLSGPSNAPMVVEQEAVSPTPVRDADKVVMSSWQSKSREESAPISMVYHESQSQSGQGELLNDVKGPPPDYDSINRQTSNESSRLSGTLSPIEPDSPEDNVPPRPEDKSAVNALLSWVPSTPISAESMPSLIQPVVIPQLDVPPKGESVPFARCYSDTLTSHNVSMRDFTAFLDGLALAQAPNSALQGLKVFGAGVSMLPIPIIPLAGRGLSALATSGSGHSGSRARLYLERAKKEYFAPRGLRVNIIKDNDLNQRLQIPAHASRLAPLTNNTLTENTCTRRLEGIAPYVAPLRFDVPEQDQQVQGVHKLARKHQERQFKREAKNQSRNREDQWREIKGLGASGWDERYSAKMSELRRVQVNLMRYLNQPGQSKDSPEMKELAHALQQGQREVQTLISERQMMIQNNRRSGAGTEAEMEEINWSRRLKWIVIENL